MFCCIDPWYRYFYNSRLNVNLADRAAVSVAGDIVPLIVLKVRVLNAAGAGGVAPVRFPGGPVGVGDGEAGVGRARLPDEGTAARGRAGSLSARVEPESAPDRTRGCLCVRGQRVRTTTDFERKNDLV